MPKAILLTCAITGLIWSLAHAQEASTQQPQKPPHWLDVTVANAVAISREVEIAAAVQQARIQIAADFCEVAVELNGRLAAVIEPYGETLELDVTPYVKLGKNRVVLRAARQDGPAAVAAELTIETSAGGQRLVTDESWQVANSNEKVRSLGAVAPELWGLGRRSAAIDAFDNYEQWRQASGGTPGSEHIKSVRTKGLRKGRWLCPRNRSGKK